MPNITLKVNDDIIRKVRKVALDKNTTLTAMVRSFLESVAKKEDRAKERLLQRLKRSFETYGKGRGVDSWKREDLYDREVLRRH